MSNVADMPRETSFFGDVNRNFDRAARLLNYPRGLLEQIQRCNSVYLMQFPVRMAKGKFEVVSAWRVDQPQNSRSASRSLQDKKE